MIRSADLICNGQVYPVVTMERRDAFPMPMFGHRCFLLLVCVRMCLQGVEGSDHGLGNNELISVAGFSEYVITTLHDTSTEHIRANSPTLVRDNCVHATGKTELGNTLENDDCLVAATTAMPPERITNGNTIIDKGVDSKNRGAVAAIDRKSSPVGTSQSVSMCGLDDSGCYNGSDSATTSLISDQGNFTAEVTPTTPTWRFIMDAGLLCMASTGIAANVLTFVTLTLNGRAFSRFTVVLLKHQALIDAAVCALASGVFMQTSIWHVKQKAIDYAICFVWHSQYIYWANVILSVWNLVFIAVDRLMAVCFPVKYKTLSVRSLKIAIAVMYVPCILSPAPSMLLVNFAHGRCSLGTSLPPDVVYTFYYAFSVYWLLVAYIIPVVAFFVIYGRIVYQLRRHRTNTASVLQSQAITTSTIRVTKCAITVTAIFIVTISYDSIFFFLGSIGVTSYDLGSTVQLVGIMMTVCNSLANPFMYTIFMPAFRRSLHTTVCRRCNAVDDDSSGVVPGSSSRHS